MEEKAAGPVVQVLGFPVEDRAGELHKTICCSFFVPIYRLLVDAR